MKNGKCILALALLLFLLLSASAQSRRSGSHARAPRETLSAEERDLVTRASGVICAERVRDPKASVPIDDMQKRPSLPLRDAGVVDAVARAEKLLPVARELVANALKQLSTKYNLNRSTSYNARLSRALARVQSVKRIKPDMDARDNASVYLRNPRTITFGTIFLAGLPSDEGMISVLSHELVHIADGDSDSLSLLFRAIGARASDLTSLKVRDQRAEELTCDLVGELAVQSFISQSPGYEPLSRRLARSLEHNCVDEDTSDEEHLSPRSTINAILTLDPTLRRLLVFGQ